MATEGYSALSAFGSKIRLMGMNNNLFDTTALVEAELEMLEMQIRPKERQKEIYTEERGAWQSFKNSFGSISEMLRDVRSFDPKDKIITYSQENIVGVTANASATSGKYNVTVSQLAEKHQIAGMNMGSSDTALGLDDSVTINGAELTLTADMTLRDVVNAVNGGDFGASASIIANRLVLSSEQTGLGNQISVSDGLNGALKAMGILAADDTIANELQSPQDAEYSINGINLTSTSNSVSGDVEGVSMDLQNVSSLGVSFTIGEDTEATFDKISEFVKGYNNAIMQLNKHTEKGNYLQGQSIPLNVRRELSTTPYYTSPGGGKLYEVGVEIDGEMKNGTLRLDETKLKEMMAENPQKVNEIFFGQDGIANFLRDKMEPYTKESGSINSKISGLDKSIESLTESIERFDRTYELQRDSLLKKYSAFETMMANLNSQQMYMEAQIKAMTGNNN